MFCPKCGTQNPDNGKFCRSCGTDLGNVSAVLAGKPDDRNRAFGMVQPIQPINPLQMTNRKGKPVHWEGAMGKIFSGLAFLTVAIVLAVTGAAGGHAWWFWLLIPAFGSLGGGIAQIIQLKKMEKGNFLMQPNQNAFPQNYPPAALPGQADLERIKTLLNSGNKITAIKDYRELTGASLKDAKEAVGRIERGELFSSETTNAPNAYEPPPRGSIYDTGELQIPPSVTESTTRHLKIDKEGETMTLPQKK